MKEPLVFLPGMMCDGRLFAHQVAAFSHERPVMIAPMTGSDTMTGLAKAILERVPSRFALGGLSMGGIVAMEIVRLASDRVTRLALMDTNPLADPPEKKTVREDQVKRVIQGQLRAVMRDEMKPNYLADGPNHGRILDLCMAMAETIGPEGFASQTNAIQTRPDQCETLRHVTVPSLVLCGAVDQLCPVERHKLMQTLIPGARLTVVAGAGHLPVLEQPEQTNEALTEWLAM